MYAMELIWAEDILLIFWHV